MAVTGADIVAKAETQLGSTDWYKYLHFYGIDFNTDWCMAFVNWVFGQFNLQGIAIRESVNCTPSKAWFVARNRYETSNAYIPQPGDNIFYKWYEDGPYVHHVGIVRYTSGDQVHTIEGNVNRINGISRVAYKQRSLTYGPIDGYGRPYLDNAGPYVPPDPEDPWNDPGHNPYEPGDEHYTAWVMQSYRTRVNTNRFKFWLYQRRS